MPDTIDALCCMNIHPEDFCFLCHLALSKYHNGIIKWLLLNVPLQISTVCGNTCQSTLGTYQICPCVLNEAFPLLFPNAIPPLLQRSDLAYNLQSLHPQHPHALTDIHSPMAAQARCRTTTQEAKASSALSGVPMCL